MENDKSSGQDLVTPELIKYYLDTILLDFQSDTHFFYHHSEDAIRIHNFYLDYLTENIKNIEFKDLSKIQDKNVYSGLNFEINGNRDYWGDTSEKEIVKIYVNTVLGHEIDK